MLNTRIFEARHYRVGAQVLFWMCLLGTVNLLFVNANMPRNLVIRTWILTASIIFLVSWNVYYLVPRFFVRQKYGTYILIVLLSVLVLFLAVTLMEYLFPPKFIRKFPLTQMRKTRYGPPGSLPFFNPRNLFVLVSYTAAIMASTVFESVQLHRRQERIAGTIKRKKLEAEMKFLKSQINPHFLFNALNNVYTLSLIKSDHTPEVVMKLSEMLRYMLHESNQERVSLGQEIQYIENFISIQQLKDDAPLAVELNISVDEPATPVAPMILLPFIENAFKHSKVEDTKRGWIRIELLESHQHLQFRVVNSRFMISYTQDPTGGIGLQNVKRRLELEYPGRYELDIREEEEQFAVALSISLS